MRAALTVLLMFGCAAGVALAQTDPPPRGGPKAPAKSVGAPNGRNSTNDALASCLSQWEKSTHMSRQEWARACRRVADRIQNLNVK